MTTILIEDIVNQSILDKNKKRKGKATSFWISSAYSCNRKRYWARLNIEKTNPPAISALRRFHVGDMFHKWIQSEMQKHAKGFEIEYYVTNDTVFGSPLSGYIDCIARFNGVNTLYEFKSISSMGFKFLKEKKYGASMSHLMQAITYYLILEKTKEKKIDDIRIVYVDKDSLRIKEIPVPISKESRNATIKDWKDCIAYFVKNELPPATPKEKWECKYCPYKDLCKQTEEYDNK